MSGSPSNPRTLRHVTGLVATLALLGAGTVAGPGAVGATPAAPTYAVNTLPIAYATSVDISGDGDLAGVAAMQVANGANAGKPFVWSPAAGLVILPMPAGATSPSVVDVSSDGWVLGTMNAGTATQPVVWKPTRATYPVLTVPNPAGKVGASAVAMDETHRVVGSVGTAGSMFRTPVLWTEAGGSRDLVALGYPTDSPVTMSGNGYVATPAQSYRR